MMENNTSGIQGVRFLRVVTGDPPVWNYKISTSWMTQVPALDKDGKPVMKPKVCRTSFATHVYGPEFALTMAVNKRKQEGMKVCTPSEAIVAWNHFLLVEKELYRLMTPEQRANPPNQEETPVALREQAEAAALREEARAAKALEDAKSLHPTELHEAYVKAAALLKKPPRKRKP